MQFKSTVTVKAMKANITLTEGERLNQSKIRKAFQHVQTQTRSCDCHRVHQAEQAHGPVR